MRLIGGESRLILTRVYLDDGRVAFLEHSDGTELDVKVKGSFGETGELNATATVGGNAVDGTFVYTPPANTVLNAGPNQQLSVTFTPNDTSAYASATKTVSINVQKATLTVSADNQTRAAGVANPTLTASYSGFVNGDTATAVTGSPDLSTTATTSSPLNPCRVWVNRIGPAESILIKKAVSSIRGDSNTMAKAAAAMSRDLLRTRSP